ncbi:MAG: hypothetical protein O7F75_11920, partial [Alphaproteobacteria bacterium]|nr:hypothetical protein [Alphaproteobacteria bacterium]
LKTPFFRQRRRGFQRWRPPIRKSLEAVEKVRPIKFLATIVPVSLAKRNIIAKVCRSLKHCFENFDPRDFFNRSTGFPFFNREPDVYPAQATISQVHKAA